MMRVYLIVILSIAANPLIQSFTDTAKETIRVMSSFLALSCPIIRRSSVKHIFLMLLSYIHQLNQFLVSNNSDEANFLNYRSSRLLFQDA